LTRAGRDHVRAANILLRRGEVVRSFGCGWLISSKGGFEPCPWSFDFADFCAVSPGSSLLDLGCGAGPLLIALSQENPSISRLVGVELERKRADQAQRNINLNRIQKAHIIQGDIREISFASKFDLIVANPPFYPAGWGRQSRYPEVALATHALNGDVSAFALTAAQLLAPDGTAVFVYDGGRVAEAMLAISVAGLTLKRIRFLDDDRGRPARVLLQAEMAGSGLVIERRRAKNV
jgi:tRNA1Val (adenine37-N6)-methyltransferase